MQLRGGVAAEWRVPGAGAGVFLDEFDSIGISTADFVVLGRFLHGPAGMVLRRPGGPPDDTVARDALRTRERQLGSNVAQETCMRRGSPAPRMSSGGNKASQV